MKKFLLGLFLLPSLCLANPPIVWGPNSTAEMLTSAISFNPAATTDYIMSGNLDPSAVAVSAPKGSLYSSTNGTLYIKQDAGSSTNWTAVASSLTVGALDGQAVNAKGAAIAASVLYMQSADATHPGLINNNTQTISGGKTFTSATSFAPGSAAAVGLYLSTDVGTGLWRTGVDSLGVSAAGSNVLTIGTSGLSVTGTITGSTLTSGSVLFAGASGVLSQDNNNFLWDAVDARLAIGGAGVTPSAALDIHHNGNTLPLIQANNIGTQSATGGGFIQVVHDSGAAMGSGNRLGSFQYAGAKNSGAGFLTGAAIDALTTQAWTAAHAGASLSFYTTPNNSITNTRSLLLDQDQSATFANTVTATTFVGALTGTATNATNGTTVQTATNASFFPLFVSSSTNGNQAFDLGTGLTFNPSTNNLSTTTFTGALSGNATTATTATTATNANNVATTQVSNSASYFPLMVSSSTNGNQAADLGTGLTFNPSTNNLSTTTFTGALSGNATTATSATTATTATNATNVATTATNSTNASFFPTFVSSSTSSNQGIDTATGLTFNPSTNNLSTTTFTGALSGNATTATSATSATTATTATNITGGAGGSIPYQTAASTTTMLANGSSGNYLKSAGGTSAPTWQAFTVPTVQTLTTTGSQTGWLFTISTSSTLAVGDTYTNNSNTYTVQGALSAQSGQVLFMSGTGATSGSTLTRATGSGTSSITFSAKVATATYTPTSANILYAKIHIVGAGGGGLGNGGVSGAQSSTPTFFGANIIIANGGTNGGGGGTITINSPATKIYSITGGTGGGYGLNQINASSEMPGGMGAPSSFAGAGAGGNAGTNGGAATGYGSGGGGGGSSNAVNNASGSGGGAGGEGEAFLSGLAASYPYVIGQRGTGGNGTTSVGGDGLEGIVEIYEYYQ